MSCGDIPDWYLRHHLAVLDLGSASWSTARANVLPRGYEPAVCLGRLVQAGRMRRLKRAVYLVIDTARETPSIAIASGLFAETSHYVTTDAALAFHGLIDQPVSRITVVQGRSGRPVAIGTAMVVPVHTAARWLSRADAYTTSVEGFSIRVGSREQAVVDALAEPAWMTHGSLLPEVLGSFSDEELDRTAAMAIERSTAAGQRLGYLIEEAQRTLPTRLMNLRPVRSVRLRPGKGSSGGYSTRWRVYG